MLLFSMEMYETLALNILDLLMDLSLYACFLIFSPEAKSLRFYQPLPLLSPFFPEKQKFHKARFRHHS